MTEQRTPAVAATSPQAGIWRAIMPERAVEDVLRGVVRIDLGGEEFQLAVLPIAKADLWRDSLVASFGDIVGSLEGQTDAMGVLSFLGSHTPTMLALLRAYDEAGALPDDEWVRQNATEPQVLRAFVAVMAASYPFIAAALDILAANPNALRLVMEEFGTPAKSIPSGLPTSTSPGTTDGPSQPSARRSRTSNSRATSRRR